MPLTTSLMKNLSLLQIGASNARPIGIVDDNRLRFRPGGEIVGSPAVTVPAGIRGESRPDFIDIVSRTANHILVMTTTIVDATWRIVNVRWVGGGRH